jgi:hypothetical protein
MTLHHLRRTPWRLVSAAATWPVASQQQSRRNALVASTALTQHRVAIDDVEDYFAGRATGDTAAVPSVTATA